MTSPSMALLYHRSRCRAGRGHRPTDRPAARRPRPRPHARPASRLWVAFRRRPRHRQPPSLRCCGRARLLLADRARRARRPTQCAFRRSPSPPLQKFQHICVSEPNSRHVDNKGLASDGSSCAGCMNTPWFGGWAARAAATHSPSHRRSAPLYAAHLRLRFVISDTPAPPSAMEVPRFP